MNLNGTNNHTVCLPSCLSFSNKNRRNINLPSPFYSFLILSNEVVFSKGRLSPDGTESLLDAARWMELRAGFLLVFFHLDRSRLANRVLFSRPNGRGLNGNRRLSTTKGAAPPAAATSLLAGILPLPPRKKWVITEKTARGKSSSEKWMSGLNEFKDMNK